MARELLNDYFSKSVILINRCSILLGNILLDYSILYIVGLEAFDIDLI